jgi:F-type H+-transporting ATPase subunit epsilon
MRFLLASSAGTKYDDEAYEVIVPTKGGTISIFAEHMPLVSAAQAGVLSVRKRAADPDSDLEQFAINGGIVEVDGQDVRFVADDISTSDEVSEREAEAALARAQELVKNADNQTALHEAHRLLHHSSAKLHLAQLKRRHHG